MFVVFAFCLSLAKVTKYHSLSLPFLPFLEDHKFITISPGYFVLTLVK